MPRFIDIDNTEQLGLPEDLVAIGGELNTENLIEAYKSGVFPWPEDDSLPVLWFCPDPRGILRWENLHISRSLRRTLKKMPFECRTDTAFDNVIHHCQTARRPGQDGTWITPRMRTAYSALHRQGIAHSIETYLDGQLAGGVYGVYINNTFSGESMFHLRSDASKVALVRLMQALQKSGITWIDTQMITPVTEALGGELVPRRDYLNSLSQNSTRAHIPWSTIKNAL